MALPRDADRKNWRRQRRDDINRSPQRQLGYRVGLGPRLGPFDLGAALFDDDRGGLSRARLAARDGCRGELCRVRIVPKALAGQPCPPPDLFYGEQVAISRRFVRAGPRLRCRRGGCCWLRRCRQAVADAPLRTDCPDRGWRWTAGAHHEGSRHRLRCQLLSAAQLEFRNRTGAGAERTPAVVVSGPYPRRFEQHQRHAISARPLARIRPMGAARLSWLVLRTGAAVLQESRDQHPWRQ